MSRNHCRTRIDPPFIDLPAVEFDREERALLQELARTLATKFVAAAEADDSGARRCGIGRLAAERAAAMPAKSRRRAINKARKIAGDSDAAASPGLSRNLRDGMRAIMRTRADHMRKGIRAALADIGRQFHALDPDLAKTSVKLRPDIETHVEPRRSHCETLPTRLIAEWKTDEPGAGRAYWELRGPRDANGDFPFVDRGYAENLRDDGSVGGFFIVDMTRYAPMLTPLQTAEYHLRVLPLPAASGGLTLGHWGGNAAGQLGQEPPAPSGVGPWSPPAVIQIGLECRSPSTVFDFEEIDYFRRLRLHIDWFRVDADQPGPGDEEYHLAAFMVKGMKYGPDHDDGVVTSLGKFEANFTVPEGDNDKIPFTWSSPQNFLPGPRASRWPYFMLVFSVLEEDGGDQLEEFYETMAELLDAALFGDLRDEITDYLRDIEDDIEQARQDLHTSLQEAAWDYITEIVGAALDAALGAVIGTAYSMIEAWLKAGSVDDHYGVEVVTIQLLSNDLALLNAGKGWVVKSSRPLSSADSTSGTEAEGRFSSNDIVLQLIARESPDGAGLDGIVSIGMSLEFSDKTRMSF